MKPKHTDYQGFKIELHEVDVDGKPKLWSYSVHSRSGKTIEGSTLFPNPEQAHRAARRYILKRVKLKGDYKW